MPGSYAVMNTPGSLSQDPAPGMTYGRARLLLGVSGVGTWVVLAALALAFGAPGWLSRLTGEGLSGGIGAVAGLVALAAVIQAPFDLFGGYLLPGKHGRLSDGLGAFAARWGRGVIAGTAVSLVVGLSLLLASRWAGAPGMVAAGFGASLIVLAARVPLARLVGGHRRTERPGSVGRGTVVLSSSDVGFTGGIAGVFRAGPQLLPARWADTLDPDSLSLVLERRRAAVESGLWIRGRLGALAFVWAGLALAGALVGDLAGTAGGVLAFASVFTLWSFAGLLILPTLSRRASIAVDGELIGRGVNPSHLRALASRLDGMQDDEPSRPGWIEAVFHPIPNVTSRRAAPARSSLAAWDIARTAAFLGVAGLSPLGRAVHCNSGRPALWVFLPLD